jgi:hypothetical protein
MFRDSWQFTVNILEKLSTKRDTEHLRSPADTQDREAELQRFLR